MRKQATTPAPELNLPDFSSPEEVSIPIASAQPVSGLLQRTTEPRAGYVLAHGAGAGMRHPFLADMANRLAAHHLVTLRYQFPYMEQGSRRPDSPKVAQAAVRAAVIEASRLAPGLPLFAGGKSFGGRMSSQAQAESPLPGVRGLVFLGFPLHPPGRPSDERAEHLFKVRIPMLFLQGDRDEFAQLDLLQSVVNKLGPLATLKLFPDADHSFHVPARTGRKDPEVRSELVAFMQTWISSVLSVSSY
jgi:predicted alpha/beta-hydrolase family hydrolase